MRPKHQRLLESLQVGSVSLWEWAGLFRDYVLRIDDEYDPGHRIDHVDRVFVNALELAEDESADLAIIVPAVYLHDCVPVSKFSEKRPEASRLSARKAAELLQENGYPAEYTEAIQHAIAAHSYSACITPETLEAKVVQDADRLDSLGAIGIARVFLVGGQFNNAIYNPDEPFPTDRVLEEKKYIVDHFHAKLLKLGETFNTRSGKQEAKQRLQYMRDFIEELQEEVEGEGFAE